MTVKRQDPYQGFRFRVEVDDLVVGGFSEVSGFQTEIQVEEFREGGVNDYVHRLPKETRYQNLVLKRGLGESESLWAWHCEVVKGRLRRRTVNVILLDSAGDETWRLSFRNAYPVKWLGTELKADSASVVFETIEFAHTGFTKY